ncbi:Ig-like domain-containing protein, partial [Escherichia coli]|uniref:Ig-like domain-containing protein n=1 Tax=Escherichia coli TaxID=562 RepID=UPI0021577087
GVVSVAALTNDTTPTISGSGVEAGSTLAVTVTDALGAVQTLSVMADAAGVWSVASDALADGTFNVSAVATDMLGNVSVAATASGVVDTAAPNAGAVSVPAYTLDTTPAIIGSGAEVGAAVSVLVQDANGATQTLTTTVGQGGAWSISPT